MPRCADDRGKPAGCRSLASLTQCNDAVHRMSLESWPTHDQTLEARQDPATGSGQRMRTIHISYMYMLGI